MADKPVTIQRERIGRQIGHLDDQDVAQPHAAGRNGSTDRPEKAWPIGPKHDMSTWRKADISGDVTLAIPWL